jgi:hypothetical protein
VSGLIRWGDGFAAVRRLGARSRVLVATFAPQLFGRRYVARLELVGERQRLSEQVDGDRAVLEALDATCHDLADGETVFAGSLSAAEEADEGSIRHLSALSARFTSLAPGGAALPTGDGAIALRWRCVALAFAFAAATSLALGAGFTSVTCASLT